MSSPVRRVFCELTRGTPRPDISANNKPANCMNADIASQRALDRLRQVGFDALTEQEKTLAAVWSIEATVDNEGFEHFFAHARGDLAFYAPQALTSIGALSMAALAAKANSVFGPDGPPRDGEKRRALVKAFSEQTRKTLSGLDDAFLESPDETDALVEAYLAKAKKS
jgi:hypothetical protein